MRDELWSHVDRYLEHACDLSDPALDRTLASSVEAGLPAIAVSPCQGMLLHLLAKSTRAERALEIGTLGGYSTICLARALPPTGRLLSLEIDERHAGIARDNISHAGLRDRVEVRVAAALDELPRIDAAGEKFDFFFVDADKENIAAYFSWCVRLARGGALIVIDNVIRDGQVADDRSADPRVTGVRDFFDALPRFSNVRATAIQTVGIKGYDGFAIARVE